jgi:uncharacterized protein (TIGR03118 family)
MRRRYGALAIGAAALFSTAAVADHDHDGSAANAYDQRNLVSNLPGTAEVTDGNLVNPWGIVVRDNKIIVADNGPGLSTRYRKDGEIINEVINIPAPPGGESPTGTPSGMIRNLTDDFRIPGTHKPARLLFATEDGTVAAWNPEVDQENAILVIDKSSRGSVYKGIAQGKHHDRDFLYVTDFHNNRVVMFNAHFEFVRTFTDDNVPCDFAPFGIRNIGGKLYVTFAKQLPPENHDDEAGPGNGFVDVFDTGGHLEQRLISHGKLNSPWGLALAPDNFGEFSGALLVGNFGNGKIHAYDINSGDFLGTLRYRNGDPVFIDGLWGITFQGEDDEVKDDDDSDGSKRATLYFTAGLNGEQDGLMGSLRPSKHHHHDDN